MTAAVVTLCIDCKYCGSRGTYPLELPDVKPGLYTPEGLPESEQAWLRERSFRCPSCGLNFNLPETHHGKT